MIRPGFQLVRYVAGMAQELRYSWATGRRVALSTEDERIEGWVQHVSATDAFVVISARDGQRRSHFHVPLQRVLAVHNPSRLGDSTVAGDERWNGMALRVLPQREQLPGMERFA